jgi:hypothetical protein
MSDTETKRGLYQKFRVLRRDGGKKHRNCEYFVLDWQHDPFTIPAMLAYANACEASSPALAKDIRDAAKYYEGLRLVHVD